MKIQTKIDSFYRPRKYCPSAKAGTSGQPPVQANHAWKIDDKGDEFQFLGTIINDYLNNNSLKRLLDNTSQELLFKCNKISKSALRIVCFLFWRDERKQYCREDLKYITSKTISDRDLPEILDQLVNNKLITSHKEVYKNNFEGHLNMQTVKELQRKCKWFDKKTKSKQPKYKSIGTLNKLTKNKQKTIPNYFAGRNETVAIIVANNIKIMECYKLSNDAYKILHNLHILMLLGVDYKIIRNKELGGLLRKHKSKDKPSPINKTMAVDNASAVFQSRKQFDKYLDAHAIYENYRTINDIEVKCKLVHNSYELYKNISDEHMNIYRKLPYWLRCFTSADIYIKILESGVQDLKNSKKRDNKYSFAIDILDLLIQQTDFRQQNKAEWYLEKALILHTNLFKSEQAIMTLLEGFNADISEETKYTLQSRSQLIADLCKVNTDETISQSLREYAKKYRINKGSLHADYVDISKGKVKNPELYCILHYKKNGFPRGEHWEGNIVITMFFCIFWDIIYTKPPKISGIFMSHYQDVPLDMYTECFYNNRKMLIDYQLLCIKKSTDDMIVEMIRKKWEEIPEHWPLITRSVGLLNLEEVVRCLGVHAVSAICQRLATNFDYTRTGFPDLTLWNVQDRYTRFVEVKANRDRPFTKQLQWLHYLSSQKISAGFCYLRTMVATEAKGNVKSDSGKRLKHHVTSNITESQIL